MAGARVWLGALAVLLVGGCAAPSAPVAGSSDPGGVTPPTSSTPAPVSVAIPSIGVDSPPLIALGLDAHDELQAPPLDQPGVGGWYADGVRPGAPGPSVLAAHINGRVNGKSTPGLFAHLSDLKSGAEVRVKRADGSVVVFRVTKVASYPKAAGIPASVYADTPGPELRLITCGGTLDTVAHSYLSNIVAWAVAA